MFKYGLLVIIYHRNEFAKGIFTANLRV